MKDYLGRVGAESAAVTGAVAPFEATLVDLRGRFDALAKAAGKSAEVGESKRQALADSTGELREAAKLYEADANELLASLAAFFKKYAKAIPEKNDAQHAARVAFDLARHSHRAVGSEQGGGGAGSEDSRESEGVGRVSWQASRLGDVVTLKRGHDLPESQRHVGDVPVVSSSGVTGYDSEPKARGPGVVTGRYGTLGEVFYLDWSGSYARRRTRSL